MSQKKSKGVKNRKIKVSKEAKPDSSTLPKWMNDRRAKLWIIFGLACLVYCNTVLNDYAQDDAIVITDNVFTKKGFQGISDHFTNELFYGFFQDESKANLVSGGRYRPLSPAMFAIEYELFGGAPWIGHFMNVLLFGVTGVMLFLVLHSLFKKYKRKDLAVLLPFVATILYVTHPIHTEVVANIKGRDEILSLLGSLSAMYAMIRAHKEESLKWLALGTFFFFVALFSKENALTFVAVVPIALYYFKNAKPTELLRYTLPLAGAVVVFLMIRSTIVPLELGDAPRELMNNPFLKLEGNQYVDFTRAERLATIILTWGIYLKLLIFPHPLSHDYYPRQIDLATFGDWDVLLSLLIYIGMAAVAIRSLMNKSILGFSVIVFAATFSIVSNLFFPIGTNLSERFVYAASIGFSIALAYGIIEAANYLNNKGVIKLSNVKITLTFLIIVAGLYSIKTITRNMVWKNNYTLFTTDVKTSTRSAKLQNAAGGVKIDEAYRIKNETSKNLLLNEAVEHLNQAIEIHPAYKNAYMLRGNAFNALKNYDQAIQSYNQSLALDPDFSDAKNNLVVTYAQAGRYYGEERGDIQTARRYLLQGNQIDSQHYEINRLLGITFGIEGNHVEAIKYFENATRIEPNNANGWVNLSKAFNYLQNPQKEAEARQRALAIDPNAFNPQ